MFFSFLFFSLCRVFDKENTGKIDADELRHIFVTLGDALTQVRRKRPSKETYKSVELRCIFVPLGDALTQVHIPDNKFY